MQIEIINTNQNMVDPTVKICKKLSQQFQLNFVMQAKQITAPINSGTNVQWSK